MCIITFLHPSICQEMLAMVIHLCLSVKPYPVFLNQCSDCSKQFSLTELINNNNNDKKKPVCVFLA